MECCRLATSENVLVCNDGDATLSISNPASVVSGVGFLLGNAPSGTLAAGTCSQMQVRFDTSSPGSYQGSVDIASNDPDEPTYSFSLTGTANGELDTQAPRLFIGRPLTDEVISGAFLARGWALDAAFLTAAAFSFEIDSQPVTLGGFLYGDERAGACNANSDLSSPNCPNVGWQGTIDTSALSNGEHTITIRGVDPSGNVRYRSIPFVVDNPPVGDMTPPRLALGKPSASGDTAFGQFIVTGWALDEGTLSTASFAFHVDGEPASLGDFTYGFPEPAGCSLHPSVHSPNCPNVRWRGYLDTLQLTNGWHTFVFSVTDPAGNTASESNTFYVDNRPPMGEPPRTRIDSPTHGQTVSGVFVFEGWAIDDDWVSAGTNIRFELDGYWIDPPVGYELGRQDVCSAHGDLESPNCPFVGWRITSGTHDLYNGHHILRIIVTDQDGNRSTFDRGFITSN